MHHKEHKRQVNDMAALTISNPQVENQSSYKMFNPTEENPFFAFVNSRVIESNERVLNFIQDESIAIKPTISNSLNIASYNNLESTGDIYFINTQNGGVNSISNIVIDSVNNTTQVGPNYQIARGFTTVSSSSSLNHRLQYAGQLDDFCYYIETINPSQALSVLQPTLTRDWKRITISDTSGYMYSSTISDTTPLSPSPILSLTEYDYSNIDAEYYYIKSTNLYNRSGSGDRSEIKYLDISYQPYLLFKFDSYTMLNTDGTNSTFDADGYLFVNLYSIISRHYNESNTPAYNTVGNRYGYSNQWNFFKKEDDIVHLYYTTYYNTDEINYYNHNSETSQIVPLIKKDKIIDYLNFIGIPWTFDKQKAISANIEDFEDGYNPNPELPGKEGQPTNEAGGGDGTGDNTQDNFELPTPTINPATAAVNQYILNSNQVYSFMEELFNGTFWTNSDLLNKNPKESVVSLTAWPINLLNWDLNNVGIPEAIVCGNVTMDYAQGQPIQHGYNKIVDIGEYEIKPYFGSFMDYLTKIELFLPFIGWRDLNTQNVMGRTIKVKYVLNFEDGGVVVYITSSDGTIERLEQVEQAKLAFDLPIFTSNINEKEKEKLQLLLTAAVSAATAGFGALGSGVGHVAATTAATAAKEVTSGASKLSTFQNHVNGGSVVASNATWYLPNKCILKFTRPYKSEASGYGRVNGYPANYTAKLGDVAGYTEVDNPILNDIECTEIERQKIKTLLQGGIYL